MRRRCASPNTTLLSMHSRGIKPKPLDMSVLPGRTGGRGTIANAHRPHAPDEGMTVHAVAIADQVLRRLVPGESLSHLLGDPFGGWMSGDAEAYQQPAVVAEHHQTVEQFEERGWYDEQVDRSNARGMVAQESLPALGWWSAGPWHHVLRHGRLRNLDAEHEQFAVNTRRAPERVGHAHLPDQVPDLAIKRWPSRAWRDFHRQYARKPRRCQRMDPRFGSDDPDCVQDRRENPVQPNQPQAVRIR